MSSSLTKEVCCLKDLSPAACYLQKRFCRDDAVRKAEEAAAEAASSRQQISAAAERAASLRNKMESTKAEADAARQVTFQAQLKCSDVHYSLLKFLILFKLKQGGLRAILIGMITFPSYTAYFHASLQRDNHLADFYFRNFSSSCTGCEDGRRASCQG